MNLLVDTDLKVKIRPGSDRDRRRKRWSSFSLEASFEIKEDETIVLKKL